MRLAASESANQVQVIQVIIQKKIHEFIVATLALEGKSLVYHDCAFPLISCQPRGPAGLGKPKLLLF
jgi:hypothetical protein